MPALLENYRALQTTRRTDIYHTTGIRLGYKSYPKFPQTYMGSYPTKYSTILPPMSYFRNSYTCRTNRCYSSLQEQNMKETYMFSHNVANISIYQRKRILMHSIQIKYKISPRLEMRI